MIRHKYKQNAYYLMYLIRCVLNNKIPAKEKLDTMDLSGVFAVAKAHSLTSIASYALESAGIYDKDFEEEKNKAIRKTIILDAERENVLAEFEKAGIWYMPLKGIIIKDLYPQIGMRQMCDNDILIDKNRTEDVRVIMECLGFTTKHYNYGYHDVFFKKPVSNFEIHKMLFGDWHDIRLYNYYDDIKKRLIKKKENGYEYCFSIEDYYVYLIVHGYKHYLNGGTGLRLFVDVFVYLTHYREIIDMECVYSKCDELGVLDFENKCRRTSLHILNGIKLLNDEQLLFEYISCSGAYGNVQNAVRNRIQSKKTTTHSRLNYIRDRVFVPYKKGTQRYKAYSAYYPWFYKNRARLPLLFFYRIGFAMTKRRQSTKKEIKTVWKEI